MSVLRRGYVEVTPDVSKFDTSLKTQLARQDPGGKAGKQVGGQLNRALKRFNIDPIDVKADPKSALAGIAVAEAKLRELSGQAATVEVKIQTDRALRQLSSFRKQIGDVAEDAAPEFALSFSQRLGPLLAKMPIGGPMSAALVGAGVAAAPLLGAAVAGGIIGGVGIGGVVGGLSLAAKDTRVKAAADTVGDRLEARLNVAGGAFVKPAIEGLAQVQRTIDRIDIEGLLADSAKLVPTLTTGAASAVTDLTGSLRELTGESAGPVREIADGIALIGQSASEGLSSLADNADEGANALKTLFEITGSAVTTTFQLVNALTELYGISKAIGGDFALQTLLKVTGAEMDKTSTFARHTAAATDGMSQEMIKAGVSAEKLKERQAELKAANDQLTVAQNNLVRGLDALGGRNTVAGRTADALRTAMDNIYGAAIRNTDANEQYQASWDELSTSVKANKGTLDIHSAAGRANRDVLQGLLTSNNELYIANVEAGQSVDSARKKHETRTKAIEKEAEKLGLNRTKTRELIDTYGQIPGRKATDLVVEGINQVVIELKRVYLAQRALAEGKTINQVRYEGSAAMRSLLYTGGYTGDGGKYEPKGIVHGGEYVIRKESTAKVRQEHPGLLEEMNATGQVSGYARGGLVAPVETSRYMRFPVDVRNAYVMSKAEALSKVIPAFGNWPSSPAAQRGDSGIWRQVLQLIQSGPNQGAFGNAYRPGDPKWHGSGRAVDWMGFNMDALASYLASKRPLELIHRTSQRDYAYTRGVNKGSFSEGLMNAHRNHIHIAMDDGGFRMLQPGMNLIPNGTGKPELIGGPKAMSQVAGGTTIVVNIPAGAVIASKRAAVDLLVEAHRTAKAERLIP